MKKLFIPFIILALVGICEARSTTVVVGQPIAGIPSGSCPADNSPDIDATTYDYHGRFADADNSIWYAGALVNPPASKQICKVAFMLSRLGGSLTDATFTARIWTVNGSYVLQSVIDNGTSTGVTGVDDWDNTWVVFTFPNNPSVSNGTTYAFTIESDIVMDVHFAIGPQGATPTNYIFTRWDDSAGGYAVTYMSTERMTMIRIYYYD